MFKNGLITLNKVKTWTKLYEQDGLKFVFSKWLQSKIDKLENSKPDLN